MPKRVSDSALNDLTHDVKRAIKKHTGVSVDGSDLNDLISGFLGDNADVEFYDDLIGSDEEE